jgi:hypothetical protein
MEAHYSEVSHYSSLCSHLRDYRERLTPTQRRDLEDYFVPEMPSRFLDRYVPTGAVHLARRQRRKAKTDVLTPIVHVLVALIERGKAAAHRLLESSTAARRPKEPTSYDGQILAAGRFRDRQHPGIRTSVHFPPRQVPARRR